MNSASVVWRAGEHDEVGTGRVGQQQREVLPSAGRSEHGVLGAQVLESRQGRRSAVPRDVQDQLRARGQCQVGDRVELAEHDVGVEADVQHGVGTLVDTDQHRMGLADPVPQRGEVLLPADAVDDDENRAAVDDGPDGRDARSVQQEVALAAQVLRGVGRERLELYAQPGAAPLPSTHARTRG